MERRVNSTPRAGIQFARKKQILIIPGHPTGSICFFSKVPKGEDKTGKIELWRISSEGGEPVKLPLVADGMENLRIHPDGKRISFNTFTFHRETWVMENLLPKSAGKK
jgi:hypothetical protein